jgi:hypothetical protein
MQVDKKQSFKSKGDMMIYKAEAEGEGEIRTNN